MVSDMVRWSVQAMTLQPAATAAPTLSSRWARPSEKSVWVWMSAIGVMRYLVSF